MASRWIHDWLRAQVEFVRRRILDAILPEQLLKVPHAALEVVDVRAGDFSFGDGIKAHALDARLFTRDTGWEALITTVLSEPAPIASRHIAKRGAIAGVCRRRRS